VNCHQIGREDLRGKLLPTGKTGISGILILAFDERGEESEMVYHGEETGSNGMGWPQPIDGPYFGFSKSLIVLEEEVAWIRDGGV